MLQALLKEALLKKELIKKRKTNALKITNSTQNSPDVKVSSKSPFTIKNNSISPSFMKQNDELQ